MKGSTNENTLAGSRLAVQAMNVLLDCLDQCDLFGGLSQSGLRCSDFRNASLRFRGLLLQLGEKRIQHVEHDISLNRVLAIVGLSVGADGAEVGGGQRGSVGGFFGGFGLDENASAHAAVAGQLLNCDPDVTSIDRGEDERVDDGVSVGVAGV